MCLPLAISAWMVSGTVRPDCPSSGERRGTTLHRTGRIDAVATSGNSRRYTSLFIETEYITERRDPCVDTRRFLPCSSELPMQRPVIPHPPFFFESWYNVERTVILSIVGFAALMVLLRVSGKLTLSNFNAFIFSFAGAGGRVSRRP